MDQPNLMPLIVGKSLPFGVIERLFGEVDISCKPRVLIPHLDSGYTRDGKDEFVFLYTDKGPTVFYPDCVMSLDEAREFRVKQEITGFSDTTEVWERMEGLNLGTPWVPPSDSIVVMSVNTFHCSPVRNNNNTPRTFARHITKAERVTSFLSAIYPQRNSFSRTLEWVESTRNTVNGGK